MNTSYTQAVILAAGNSSRFTPFNAVHKSLFSIMGRPIIHHTINALCRAGIKEVVIVVSPHHVDAFTHLAETIPNCHITLVVQKEPNGMADALLQARSQLHEWFIVANPQHATIDEYLPSLIAASDKQLVLSTQKTTNPHKYGMVEVQEGRVVAIVEKPTVSHLTQRLVGTYVLNQEFLEFMQPRPLEEYQLERDLNDYATNHTIKAVEIKSFTPTVKYAWDLFTLGDLLLNSQAPTIAESAIIHPTTIIEGPVIIAAGVHTYPYSIIEGPCYIGEQVVIGSYTKVRKGTILEAGVELQSYVEVKHSLIGKDTHIHSGFIGDSIIGSGARLGAGFTTANRRLDRKPIKVTLNNQRVETNLTYLGALIGNEVSAGIHSGTNPGTIIAAQEIIAPHAIRS